MPKPTSKQNEAIFDFDWKDPENWNRYIVQNNKE
jgi:hypothetical protein